MSLKSTVFARRARRPACQPPSRRTGQSCGRPEASDGMASGQAPGLPSFERQIAVQKMVPSRCRNPPWLQQPDWQGLQPCRRPVQSAFCRPRFWAICLPGTTWCTLPGWHGIHRTTRVHAAAPRPAAARRTLQHCRSQTRGSALGSVLLFPPGHAVPAHPASLFSV